MAFMIPQYTNEPFDVVTHANGESEAFPHPIHPADLEEGDEIETIRDKYWCCLSAPGYMDSTEWSGPFNTLAEAKQEIERQYDVNPDTGHDLDMGE